MKKILISWIGRTDLRAVKEGEIFGVGPIAQVVQSIFFDQIVLLNNFPEAEANAYITWLQSIKNLPVSSSQVILTSPTNFAEIYEAAVDVVQKCVTDFGSNTELVEEVWGGVGAKQATHLLRPCRNYQRSRAKQMNLASPLQQSG